LVILFVTHKRHKYRIMSWFYHLSQSTAHHNGSCIYSLRFFPHEWGAKQKWCIHMKFKRMIQLQITIDQTYFRPVSFNYFHFGRWSWKVLVTLISFPTYIDLDCLQEGVKTHYITRCWSIRCWVYIQYSLPEMVFIYFKGGLLWNEIIRTTFASKPFLVFLVSDNGGQIN